METDRLAVPDGLRAPGVHLRGARLHYDGACLFDDLTLDLPPGSWTCLLGPSGVGKSSLLRLLAGLPESGQGVVSCDDGAALPGRSAYMAQQDLLLPWLTVRENVLLGHRLRGPSTGRRWSRLRRASAPRSSALPVRADALLARTGLGAWADSLPHSLSGGMRQRAALVRTLMEDRPVVLLDEPFSALDALTRLDLQTLASELLKDRTVLLVTHDPLEALRLGDRLLVMTGRPARLVEAPPPPGLPPRPVDSPEVLAAQGGLLRLLARDSAAATSPGLPPPVGSASAAPRYREAAE